MASWWHYENDNVLCELCPHRCLIKEGNVGICGVRKNDGGELVASSYGMVCVRNLDPIEKKPLFHFHPGTLVHSFGTFGCNLDCDNCQNYELARSRSGGSFLTPQDAVSEAIGQNAHGVAFTFNEPITWYEFVLETSEDAKEKDLYTVLNTNGYIRKEPAEELFTYIDAMNIDVKAFNDQIYHSTCGGKLQPVLDTCVLAKELGIHVELTYLLIPGLNDSSDEIADFSRWVVEYMGTDTPVFFFRFSPFHRLSNLPRQSMDRMLEAESIAKQAGLNYVYFGGVADAIKDTMCPACSSIVIERKADDSTGKVCFRGDEVSRFCPSVAEVKVNIQNGCCPKCGLSIPIVL